MTPDQPSTPSPASQLPAWLSSWTGREGGKSQRCTDVRNINQHLLKLVECEVSRISLLKNDKRLQRRLLNRRINAGLKNIFWLLDKFLVYLEFFSAPGSKPFSSFAVSYPLQFPLILGRSNLFLNLWQVQFVNNFSGAAKVIGTKTSQSDQQFQGFSDPLKSPVDIASVLFFILSLWQLFCTCKYIIVKRITKHQTAVTKPEPRIKRNVTGQFPQSNCVLLFTLLLISLFGKLGSDNHKDDWQSK